MTTEVLYAHAEELLRAGQWSAAAKALTAVLQSWPQHACAHHLLGKAKAELGEPEAAEGLQRRSCELDPQLGWNWFALAELLLERGDRQKAQVAFARAATALPQHLWIGDRARRLQRRLQWDAMRAFGYQPRFSLDEFAQTVWQLRPDLRQRFGGDSEELWLWLLLEGPEEYLGAIVLRDALIERLRANGAWSPACLNPLAIPFGIEPPISQLLHGIWFQQPHLQRRFDLETLAGRVGLFWWYVLEAVEHYQLQQLLSPVERAYFAQPQEFSEATAPASRLAFAARRLAGSTVPKEQLQSWFHGTAVRQLQLGELLEVSGVETPPPVFNESSLLFGVNVIGYAEGQLGIGEDLRMAVQALDAVGMPCSVFNISPDHSIDCADRSVSARIREDLPYCFNLFCLTGIETARVGVTDTVPLMLPGRVNIGAWPWEFERWPAHWRPAYSMVDEIWASSSFAVEAYQADGAVPVEWMPMVVDVSATAGLDREDFDLPESAFLFVFAFDCSSSLRRKNPWAVLDAFQRAFPLEEGADVGLVVKVMRGQMSHPVYRRLRQRADADPRIRLLEQTLPRPELLDLFRACDAFVSLHRCEGFGRAIAEAMLLGKVVVATAYSGNLDFCSPDTALLVPAALKSVLPGDYPEAQGMMWAEPDGAEAVSALKRCQRGEWQPDPTAVASMAERYSAEAVGKRYLSRFEALRQSMGMT